MDNVNLEDNHKIDAENSEPEQDVVSKKKEDKKDVTTGDAKRGVQAKSSNSQIATEQIKSKEDKETELNKHLNVTKGDKTKGVDTVSGDSQIATENKESKEDKETELNKYLNVTKVDETKGVDTGSSDSQIATENKETELNKALDLRKGDNNQNGNKQESVDTKIMDMQIEKDDTQNRDSQKDIEHENKVNDLKSNTSKHVSFDTEIVKDDKDVHCSDPSPVADKDSLMSGQVVKCSGGGGGSKFFLKQQGDTDEYENNDCSDNEVT